MENIPVDPVVLGALLFSERVGNRGIGVREAAKQIGISPATVSRCERFKHVDTNTFLRISLWLELPGVKDLLGILNPPSYGNPDLR